MKRLFTFLLGLFCLQMANANGVQIGELYYLLNEQDLTAQVTYDPAADAWNSIPAYSNFSSKNLTIPQQVDYQNKNYKVTSIGENAFNRCLGLISVSLPDGLTSIGDDAFSYCSALTSVSFPESLTSIGAEAFYGCSAITSVSLPKDLTSIGRYVFNSCTALTTVSFPESLAAIGEAAFYSCSALKSVSFPESLTTIGYSAFSDCTSLTSVTFPDGYIVVGTYAFYKCSNLTEVNTPSLEAWYKIEFYDYSNPNYYANNLLIDGKELSGVVIIPEDWTKVPTAIYAGCDAVTEFILPKSITSISSYAFSGCSALSSIVLPEGVTSISYSAFANCSALQKVVCLNPTAPRCDYNFNDIFDENTLNTGELYVPEASLDNYKNDRNWKDFKNIKPIIQSSDLKLSAGQNILPKGESLQITATLTPADATVELFNWSCSDPSVASVDALGKVTGIKAGQATITAQTIDGSDIKATYELTVADGRGAFAIADFEINTNESIDVPVNLNSYTNEKYSALQFDVTLPEGLQFESAVLGEELIGANFQIKSTVQSSGAIRVIVTPTDNLAGVLFTENLVYIKVKANNSAVPGVKNIQITNAYLSSVDGSDLVLEDSSASVTFKSTIKTITLTPQTQNIILGQTGSITATVQPVDAANLQLLWSVNDPTVVKINGNGLNATLEALKIGSVTVTAVSPYDETIKGQATVNVVGTLQITGEKSIIKTTETLQLSASFVENDKTPEVTWSSSAPQFATVDATTGLVTGVAVGTAVITATSKEYSGITATYEVEVQQILLGDANDNGSVTVADVVTIANHIVHNPVANWCFINADVNKSGDITAADITGTINIIAGEEISAGAAVRRAAQTDSADRLLSEDFNPVEGEPFNIGVRLDNVIPYSALQASVVIPEGMTVEGVSAGSQASNHSMIYNITDDGRVEIVLFSLSNEPFNQNDKTLFNLLVTASSDCGNLEIRNIIASDSTARDYNLTFEGGKNLGNFSGLESLGNGETVVATNGHDLLIYNGAGSEACVYSVAGQLIERRSLTADTECFHLAKGIYIVTVDGKTYKIIL